MSRTVIKRISQYWGNNGILLNGLRFGYTGFTIVASLWQIICFLFWKYAFS